MTHFYAPIEDENFINRIEEIQQNAFYNQGIDLDFNEAMNIAMEDDELNANEYDE